MSEFYLTGDERFQFVMTPEEVRVKSTANFRTYNVVELGEVNIPKGEKLTAVSWRGILPGQRMTAYPFVDAGNWRSPDDAIKLLDRWRKSGTKLRLLITETPVNVDVYIKAFDTTFKGGLGNVSYDISLTAAKVLQVMTVAEADAQQPTLETAAELNDRPHMSPLENFLVNDPDTVWTAAQVLTGNGGDWASLLEKSGIVDPELVRVGTKILRR